MRLRKEISYVPIFLIFAYLLEKLNLVLFNDRHFIVWFQYAFLFFTGLCLLQVIIPHIACINSDNCKCFLDLRDKSICLLMLLSLKFTGVWGCSPQYTQCGILHFSDFATFGKSYLQKTIVYWCREAIIL